MTPPTTETLEDDDGYRLWLRYDLIADRDVLQCYRSQIGRAFLSPISPTLEAARKELERGLRGLLGVERLVLPEDDPTAALESRLPTLIVGTPRSSAVVTAFARTGKLDRVGNEGYALERFDLRGRSFLVVAAESDVGALYGVFHFLRLLQMHDPLPLGVQCSPRVKLRMLDHWDNLDRSVERGYAGSSLWDWHLLPDYLDPRYVDYARANASIGINATVLTNVNANALVLTESYLFKVAALAKVFRPYGIRVFLTARFSAPSELGGLETSDPGNQHVIDWWQCKVQEIYGHIPDFGGFLVKANSEGQPGPQDYGRSHAEGANVLAQALAPHGGIVLWRAFVYKSTNDQDRAKQAYQELTPLDGTFASNVVLQVKNGPIDFQPREPFHPLFGAMTRTPLAVEFQLTQEYLGFATHLAFLAPLQQETLEADTFAQGPGSHVSRVIDGNLHGHPLSCMAGVSNIGTERNWCGHPFAQANWYAFGRLAWDHQLSSESIADEWLRMTFTNDERFVSRVKPMMLASREAIVNYMTPLGLHHLMAPDHHYGPAPWFADGRPDWTATYYHRADAHGVGFDRTARGSGATQQYLAPLAAELDDPSRCPESLLLWFHHLPWTHRLKSGRTLWQELCYRYQLGVDAVSDMQAIWQSIEGLIDARRFEHVRVLLTIQRKEAAWWHDACLAYFREVSKLPLPPGVSPPERSLDEFMLLKHPHAPGI